MTEWLSLLAFLMEKEMATNSSILAWEIPWTGEPGGLQSMGLQESDTTERLNNKSNTTLLTEAEASASS